MVKGNCSVTGDVIVSRIIALSEKEGKPERDLVEYLGLKRGTFGNWKRGQSDSYLHYLKEIAEYYHVTPNYLILGNDGIVIGKGEDLFTKDELEVIEFYRKISQKEKKCVKSLLFTMSSETNQ